MSMKGFDQSLIAIKWQGNYLNLLDQRVLPVEERWLACHSMEDVADAIQQMVVRGAPAIGIAAAYGAYLLAKQIDWQQCNADEQFRTGLDHLESARPTAVNLAWAVSRARQLASDLSPESLEDGLLSLAHRTHEDDVEANQQMGAIALEYFRQTDGPYAVLTHCNTGSLATGGFGTALGAIRAAYAAGVVDCVYVDETRPWLQGARLTAWELAKEGIPHFLNADSASGWLMANKGIRWVIVGADRITANGDTANKVGTYNLAILAKHHGVKFMVVAPTSTIDMGLESGADIEIEMREGGELTQVQGVSYAPEGTKTINPVFDVTPADLIDVIVTEKGAVVRPTLASMQALFK